MELNSYKLLKSCQCGLQTVTDTLNNLNVLKKQNNLKAFKKDALLQLPLGELNILPFCYFVLTLDIVMALVPQSKKVQHFYLEGIK